ncbi:nuclear transcription factor Y subunit A-1-like [Mercurialis annua]|uniref:nuclear transcription factor Y subunit A-1-like n=1 Tax=Mercurialis annua TaxID=3986 RepID=UPI00215F779F|nr:nuclear transcription factor Y subunit A-1-like [Mercurialis annua]XP_050223039.1 nuclear transcription factor Y subunit A-1-like [Mercurialis annua]
MKESEGMQPNSDSGKALGCDQDQQHLAQPYSVHSEPWWRAIGGGNTVSSAQAGGNTSHLSSDSLSNDDRSMSNGGLNEEDDGASKESQATASSRLVLDSGQEHRNLQHIAPSMTAMHDEGLSQPTQLELVGHSIACASHPYLDPYYGGMMASYGHQPLGYPHFIGVPHARMPLPDEIAREPVYVNAKQYQGILRRRQARAKQELERKLVKVRKPYLHESRHKHAMRRARGSGGRFAKKTDGDSLNTAEGMGNNSGPVHSSQSGSSSGSEQMPSDSSEMWIFSHGQGEVRRALQVHDTSEAGNHVNGGGHYHNNLSGLQTSTRRSQTGEEAGNGDCSGQRRGSLSSNHTSQRPLAIQ